MRRVALFTIDGLRPDGLMAADTPTLDRLMAKGACTLQARSVMPSVTLPCHASLMLGVMPERHGITTNTWTPQVRPVPGIFEVVRAAGGKAASFYNWEQLRDLWPPGTMEAGIYLDTDTTPGGDLELARAAASWLRGRDINLTFVYFGNSDNAGHDHGWMSIPYLETVAAADRAVAHVLDALPTETLIVITTDHGGHGQSHGTDMDEDLTIPLILCGPGIPHGAVIANPVGLIDVAPTIASFLGLDRPRDWIGRPIELGEPGNG